MLFLSTACLSSFLIVRFRCRRWIVTAPHAQGRAQSVILWTRLALRTMLLMSSPRRMRTSTPGLYRPGQLQLVLHSLAPPLLTWSTSTTLRRP